MWTARLLVLASLFAPAALGEFISVPERADVPAQTRLVCLRISENRFTSLAHGLHATSSSCFLVLIESSGGSGHIFSPCSLHSHH